MRITLNGEDRDFECPLTLSDLLAKLGLDQNKIAVERNLKIVPRPTFQNTDVLDGDSIAVVHFIGGGNHQNPANARRTIEALGADEDTWTVGDNQLISRLIVGTGKYRDFEETASAIEASGAEIVTVGVRRVNVTDTNAPMLMDFIDPSKYIYLPNTAGCYTANEALRTLRLAREAGGWNLVKLEVLGDEKTLYPNMTETFQAVEALVTDGFNVMVYCNDDPIGAKRLEEMGCCAVMPAAAPIGSGLGIQNPVNIRLIVEAAQVPIIIDAGVGTSSDATEAMELVCDGVVMNTAIAQADNPLLMAKAMRLAVQSGRMAYLAGRINKKLYADPSSPLGGLI